MRTVGEFFMNLVEFILASITLPFLWLYEFGVWLYGLLTGKDRLQ